MYSKRPTRLMHAISILWQRSLLAMTAQDHSPSSETLIFLLLAYEYLYIGPALSLQSPLLQVQALKVLKIIEPTRSF